MSADNWAVCPVCKDNGTNAGKEDYYTHEFREDYEIGVSETGEFSVTYMGRCRTCGFNHKFSHSIQIYKPKVKP